mmetsp:Transcript_46567/g.122265  ORF Transcript_46567/g.122265 Transcript_46567/m.122265 type:complete len:356 (+) Transcript_46567:144-1211(+)
MRHEQRARKHAANRREARESSAYSRERRRRHTAAVVRYPALVIVSMPRRPWCLSPLSLTTCRVLCSATPSESAVQLTSRSPSLCTHTRIRQHASGLCTRCALASLLETDDVAIRVAQLLRVAFARGHHQRLEPPRVLDLWASVMVCELHHASSWPATRTDRVAILADGNGDARLAMDIRIEAQHFPAERLVPLLRLLPRMARDAHAREGARGCALILVEQHRVAARIGDDGLENLVLLLIGFLDGLVARPVLDLRRLAQQCAAARRCRFDRARHARHAKAHAGEATASLVAGASFFAQLNLRPVGTANEEATSRRLCRCEAKALSVELCTSCSVLDTHSDAEQSACGAHARWRAP